MKNIALGLSVFCHIDKFSYLFLVGVSEFCHQINFDGNELFVRPDTLSYNNSRTNNSDKYYSRNIIKLRYRPLCGPVY